MKFKRIKIILFLSIIILMIYSCTHDFQEPDIDIKKTSKSDTKNNHLFIYKIKLSANENLKYFVILPSVNGINQDSKMFYQFNEQTHYAELDYFYLLPNKKYLPKAIKLIMQIGTSKRKLKKIEVINL